MKKGRGLPRDVPSESRDRARDRMVVHTAKHRAQYLVGAGLLEGAH